MAQKILIKKSTVAAKVPTDAQLDIGELAVNTADAILYTKHSDGSIKRLSPNNGVGYGQNIINSAVSGVANISYSGTLLNNTTGNANTAVGAGALRENTTGIYNTAAGTDALLVNTTGNYNVAAGVSALRENTAGSANTAVGVTALLNNTTGDFNVAAGTDALLANTTGKANTAAGTNALRENTIGDFNTASGADALLASTTYSNCGGFGANSQVTASNQIQLGSSTVTVYAYGAVQNRSDIRDKAEVRDTVLGLDFICAIRPVDYKLDMREDYRVELGDSPTEEQLEANKLANIKADGTHTRKRYHHGVIAQEVASVIDTLGVDFGGFQDHSINGGDDVLSIGYGEFIAPLIKAVQELSARVKELEGKVNY